MPGDFRDCPDFTETGHQPSPLSHGVTSPTKTRSQMRDRYNIARVDRELGCPFHGNAQWRSIRDSSPQEWADVVAFDAAIRQGNARANATGNRLLGEAFLHRSRVPLDQAPIDHVTAAEWAALQQELGDSAADAQELEDGVIDGCSPWACRGEVEPVQDGFGLAS